MGCSGCLLREFEVAGTDIPADSLTANPSFEVGLEGWSNWQGNLDRAPHPEAPDGAFVVQVSWSSGDYFSIDDLPDTVPGPTPGDCYVARAEVAAATPAAGGKPVVLVLREKTEDVILRETLSDPVLHGETFASLAVSAIYAGTGDRLDVFVQQDQAIAGDAFFADRIIVERIGPEPDAAACARHIE